MTRLCQRRAWPANQGGLDDLYYSSSWQVLEERSSGDVVRANVWSPVYVDAMVLRRTGTRSETNGLEERLYVLHDANFNVTALVNTRVRWSSGSSTTRTAGSRFKDASWGTRASSSYGWVYLHQGGRWDATAALVQLPVPGLQPDADAWVSVDPIGFECGDTNLYRALADSPLNVVDPSGLFGYGLYCGPRNGPGIPIDGLDRACEEHDRCLATWREWINPFRVLYCDGILCREARRATLRLCSDAPDPGACMLAAAAIELYACKFEPKNHTIIL